MQKQTNERKNNEELDIMLRYEKEKEYLGQLIKQYVELNNKFAEYQGNNELDKEIIAEKQKFEMDFVYLNCEIQQIRSDNETLLDEIKHREENLNDLNQQIKEKASLIQIMEGQMLELKQKYGI